MKRLITLFFWLSLSVLAAQSGSPAVQIAVTDISCAGKTDGRLELTLLSGALPVDFQWVNLNTGALGIGQFTTLSQPILLTGLSPGLYRFNLTDANNADTSLQRQILEPLPLKGSLVLLTNFGGFPVACAQGNNGAVLLDAGGGTTPLQYQWSNGDQGVRADSLTAGPIRVTLTDARGCQLVADTVLRAPDPIATQLDIEGETCLGENTGRIELLSVTGGVPPYQFSLNNIPQGTQTTWTDLPYGQYFLDVEDAAGCVFTNGIVLPSGLEFSFSLGPDTTLLTGDTLLLTFFIDPPADTLLWEPAQGVYQISPQSALLFPSFSTTYQATAIGPKGCRATDDIRVTVSRDRDVYAPNVFDPNAAATPNRSFTLYGSAGIRTITLLQVFDRFGRLWFDNRNFPVNDPAAGWFGTDGADEAPAGVYLWRANLKYTDGREVFLQGDVTVLR